MLTGLAILERELGLIEYARHNLKRQQAARMGAEAAARQHDEATALERRWQTIRRLDELHEEWDLRHAAQESLGGHRKSTHP